MEGDVRREGTRVRRYGSRRNGCEDIQGKGMKGRRED